MSELRSIRNGTGGRAISVARSDGRGGRRMLRLAAGLLSSALILAGCSSTAERSSPDASDRAEPAATASGPAERGITNPPGVIAVNGALGADRKLVAQAIADVKTVGFWRELTGHLYSVRMGVRPGEERIPEDGHLADAIRTIKLDGDVGGIYC
ncbi:MAG: hypothetical protein H0U53_03360, partial [Actinobacteria bacterium]|nr:hypothetical protein [Actinomycetota bacterium]